MSGKLDRRGFLSAGAAMGVGLVLSSDPSSRGEKRATPRRRLFVIGGQALDGGAPDHLLLKHLLLLTRKSNPTIYYLPTASGDSAEGIARWYETMNDLACRPRHLRLFSNSARMKNPGKELLSADAIFVGGGNTLNMLSIWRAQGVDQILRQVWEQGVLLAGESAGMNCWFEQGVTDSLPEKLSMIPCLGFLKGSSCPHYNNEAPRKPFYHRLVLSSEAKEGFACDDGTGLLFEEDNLIQAVSVTRNAQAVRVRPEGGKVVEVEIPCKLLGK